jgi:hypothetical protein
VKCPRARPPAVLGEGAGRGSPPPAMGVRGITPGNFFENVHAKECILVPSGLKSGHLNGMLFIACSVCKIVYYI